MSEDKKGFDPKYDDSKTSGIVYVGKSNKKPDGSSFRKIEVLINQNESYLTNKNKEPESNPERFSVKDTVILHRSDSGQQKIQCWLMESEEDKRVDAIHISRRTGKGVYGSQEVTLMSDGIIALKKFLDNLFYIDTTNKSRIKIPLSELNCSIQTTFSKIISEKEFNDLIKANIKNTDDFYSLLSLQKMEMAVIRLEEIIDGDFKNEVEIQKFLENNLWMFGNDFVFVVKENKINASNILDLIPGNIESFIDIIEVKLPTEKLFNYDKDHGNHYATANLTKAIAQTQNYIFELEMKALDGEYQESNTCRIIRPRGIILYGHNQELAYSEKAYLRVLNASYHNLHVITYQQLLEKARNTISFSKSAINTDI